MRRYAHQHWAMDSWSCRATAKWVARSRRSSKRCSPTCRLACVFSKLHLRLKARVGLSQHCMAVTRNNFSCRERLTHILYNLFAARLFGFSSSCISNIHLITSWLARPCKGTGEAVHTGSIGKIASDSAEADKMGSMCRDIATFVIGVNGHIKAHQFTETMIIKTHHVGEVTCPVEQTIRMYMVAILIFLRYMAAILGRRAISTNASSKMAPNNLSYSCPRRKPWKNSSRFAKPLRQRCTWSSGAY